MPETHESPRGGFADLGGHRDLLHSLISAVLAGERQPHELPAVLHDLWRDGFTCGQVRMQPTIDRLEREADHWYFVANNRAEAVAERDKWLKHASVVQARKAVAA